MLHIATQDTHLHHRSTSLTQSLLPLTAALPISSFAIRHSQLDAKATDWRGMQAAAASIPDNTPFPPSSTKAPGTRSSVPRPRPQSGGEGGKSKAWLALCLHTRPASSTPAAAPACLQGAASRVCSSQLIIIAPLPARKACKPALIVRCGFGRRASVRSGSHSLPSHTSGTHPAGPDLRGRNQQRGIQPRLHLTVAPPP